MARIELINVCKTLGDRGGAPGYEVMLDAAHPGPRSAPARGRDTAFSIQDLNLTVPDGKTMVVLGPSGCGKTTLLKLIAGLIAPDAGDVRYDDVDVKNLNPGERRIGMVFQNYALYPHISNRRNVLSYFMFRKPSPALDAEARVRFERTSELMGVELSDLLER